jgi:glutathione S-transferase
MSVLRLYYWPGLPGRGELVRLALEDGGAEYVDVARTPGGMAELRALLDGGGPGLAPFAPPFLVDGELVLAQVANILDHVGPRLGLVEAEDAARRRALQLQLTVGDLLSEVHDTHHPVSTTLYYEQQKSEALARTAAFLEHRLPKFLRYFERAVQPEGTTALRAEHVYVDLSLFQVVEGLAYAFPKAMAALAPEIPGLVALRDRVAARPRIQAYLASPRRLAFNEHGIFRRYPELDLLPEWAGAG